MTNSCQLICAGFDTQANILLRSTGEYFEVLTAIFHDPALATEFTEADTPEKTNKFWKKHLSSFARLRINFPVPVFAALPKF